MIQIQINKIIVDGLQNFVSCPVIKSNLSTPTPKYPYISFTITSPVLPKGGTDARLGNGIYAVYTSQVWSLTIASDNDNESFCLAEKAWEWFKRAGRLYLSDNEVIVREISGISCRDNLLTNRYEYRQGFDVTFAFTKLIEFEHPSIETAIIEPERGKLIERH